MNLKVEMKKGSLVSDPGMTDEVTHAYTRCGLSLTAHRRFYRGKDIASQRRNAIIHSITGASQAREKGACRWATGSILPPKTLMKQGFVDLASQHVINCSIILL